MDDGSKTREELLLEVDELRRQLAEARATLETREEVNLDRSHAGTGRQGPAITREAKPVRSQAMIDCLSKLTARPDTPLKILLIEDNPGDARLVREMLADAEVNGISLDWVPSLSQGLEYLAQNKIDLILLDLSLPDSRGLETFCKAYTHAPEIPFVLLTGLDDETLALTAVQKGAQDYLIKGETDGHKLFRAVRYATERKKVLEALQRGRDELEHRVEARTADLVAANRKLEEAIATHRQCEPEQQRLLAEVRNFSEELRISNEELGIQGEELQVQNENLNAQAEELEDLTGELETERNLLQAVLEQMPAGVIIAEPSGRIILTNHQAEAIWQQPPGALSDLEKFRQIQRYYPDGRRCPPNDRPLWRALTLGETVTDEEYLVQRDDGDQLRAVNLNISATPVRDQHGSIIAAVATYTDITARKQAQAALRQSEERYRSLVELSPDAIVVQVQGKIVFVNKAAVKLFGATVRSDLVGQPVMDRIHPDYHDTVQDRIKTVRSSGTVGPLEEKVLRLDGEAVEVEAVGSAIVYQGRTGVQVIFRDITERKQDREALRIANAKLQALIEASPLAIVHLDREGTIQGVNPAAERIFGWRGAELLGRPLPIVHEEKQEKSREIIQRVFQGEPLTGLEVRGRRKDGAWIDVSLSLAPMHDENGEVAGIVGLAEDITARKQAEAALAKSRAEFEAIFDSISDAIIFADSERRIVLVNPAVKTLFAYDPEELIGSSAEMLYADQADFEAVREKYYSAGQPVKPARFEIVYRRKDGTLFSAETLASQVKNAQGDILGAVGIHRDITARKVAEAALKESQRQVSMLADFLENSSQPFAVGSLDGRIGMVNEAFLQLLGYSHKELSMLNWAKDLTPPEWLEHEGARLKELQRTGQSVRYEKEFLRKDGSRVPVELFMHLRRNENSQPVHYAFVTDITARKKAEAALEQERRRLYDLLDALPAFVSLHGEDHTVRFANRRMREAFGESEGRFCYEVFDKRQAPCESCPAATVIDNQTAHEWERTTDDGRTLQIYKYPFRDTDGSPCVLTLALDISARKRAEDALRESEERFRQLAENIDDTILLASADLRRVHYISPAYESIWGRTCASLYEEPRSWLESVVPETWRRSKFALEEAE